MTIIDTTLYANGALRLSRHGAGKGGNVLTDVLSGATVTIDNSDMARAEHYLQTEAEPFFWGVIIAINEEDNALR